MTASRQAAEPSDATMDFATVTEFTCLAVNI
jgi:hypothetical protein